jgi:hypothetical protein
LARTQQRLPMVNTTAIETLCAGARFICQKVPTTTGELFSVV